MKGSGGKRLHFANSWKSSSYIQEGPRLASELDGCIYVFKHFYKMPFPSKPLPLLLIILLVFYYASFAAAAEPSIQQPLQVYHTQTNSEAHYIHID